MQSHNSTYQNRAKLVLVSRIVIICLTIFLVSQPIIEAVFHLEETSFYLFEDLEEKDSSKKEELKEKNDKERKSLSSTPFEPEINCPSLIFTFNRFFPTNAYFYANLSLPLISIEVIAPPPEQSNPFI